MTIKLTIARLHGLKSSDPIYDTLMQAYIAAEERRPMSVSAIASMAGVAATTSLRYLDALVRKGILVRTPDSEDARRSWITLSPAMKAGMDQVFGPL